jgi:uncharacterized protein (TIGR02996 family)
MATKPASLIAKATVRLEANAYEKATELLVTAWRGHRSARLATLVERAGVLANEPVLPAGLTDANRAPQDRIAALRGLPQDPRIVPALLALARASDRPLAGPGVGAAQIEAILAQQDPATEALLAALDDKGRATRFVAKEDEHRLRVARPAADTEIEAACQACDRALFAAELRVEQGRERGRALLAAVYADPADLGARAIYADWLVERGDPRGELIALQLVRDLTEAQRARMQELAGRYRRAWLGPLAEACTSVWFEAGFPAGAVTDPARLVATRDAVEWSTITELTFSSPQGIPLELADAPALRNLQFLGGIQPEKIYAFRRERVALDIAGLGLASAYPPSRHVMFEVFELVEYLELEELGFSPAPESFAKLFAFAAARRISRVRLPPMPGMLAAIAGLPDHVTRVELALPSREGWAFAWSRAPDDPRWSRLAIEHRPRGDDVVAPVDELISLIANLPTAQLETCSLRLIGSRAGAAELGALATAVRRQRRLRE